MPATLPLGREVFLEQTAYFSIPGPPPPSFRFHPTSASVHSLEQGLIFHVYMATSKHHPRNLALSAETRHQFQTKTHYKPSPFCCEGFNCIRIARAMAHREYFSLTSLSSFKKQLVCDKRPQLSTQPPGQDRCITLFEGTLS